MLTPLLDTEDDHCATILEAARNNAEWCEAMCRAHGTFTRWAWTSKQRTPALYPDAVTLLPETGLDDILNDIGAMQGCSAKDSFACLDLSAAGFEPIIHAQWIVHSASRPMPLPPTPWTAVRTARGLDEWVVAWNGGPASLFRPQLLAHPAVRVLTARRDGVLVAGAVVHNSRPITGVSNLFAVDGDLDSTWAGVLSALPGRRVAGYETGPALASAVRLGFTRAGPLRVWLRTSPAREPLAFRTGRADEPRPILQPQGSSLCRLSAAEVCCLGASMIKTLTSNDLSIVDGLWLTRSVWVP